MRIRSSSWQPMSACIQGLAAGYPVTLCDESSGGSSAISADRYVERLLCTRPVLRSELAVRVR